MYKIPMHGSLMRVVLQALSNFHCLLSNKTSFIVSCSDNLDSGTFFCLLNPMLTLPWYSQTDLRNSKKIIILFGYIICLMNGRGMRTLAVVKYFTKAPQACVCVMSRSLQGLLRSFHIWQQFPTMELTVDGLWTSGEGGGV